MEEEPLLLPPGFRFHPTDEEIISQYLSKKVADRRFSAVAVGEADLNSCEPWDLPKKAKMGEKVWYFFCQKDRKYPTGMRTNRATETGYWKATGKDKEIHGLGRGRVLVGMKKTLVFYTGRAPKGENTNWVMHEFRLEGSSHLGSLPQVAMESWVVCRVFHKNKGIQKTPISVMSMEAAPVVGQQFNQIQIQNQENPSHFVSQIPPPNPFFSHGGSAGSGYLHWPEEGRSGRAYYAPTVTAMSSSPAFVGQCKVEQVSNSMPASHSQEPGMSSGDLHHPEISSYNADGSSSADPLFGLENFWYC